MPTALSRRSTQTDVRNPVRKPDRAKKKIVAGAVAVVALAAAGHARADDLLVTKAAPAPAAYDWTGFYAGGHLGYAWGSSNFTDNATGAPAPAVSGTLDFAQPIDTFDEAGSFFAGFQGGYNHMFANRLLLGVEADASFPSFRDLAGLSIGGTPDLYLADQRLRDLQRERAVRRHRARPHRLCAGTTGCSTRPAVSPGPTISSR